MHPFLSISEGIGRQGAAERNQRASRPCRCPLDRLSGVHGGERKRQPAPPFPSLAPAPRKNVAMRRAALLSRLAIVGAAVLSAACASPTAPGSGRRCSTHYGT